MPIPEKYQAMFEESKASFLKEQEQSRIENWEWNVSQEIIDILMKTSCQWETRAFIEENYFKLRDDLYLKIHENKFRKFIREKMKLSEERIINLAMQMMKEEGHAVSTDDIDGLRKAYKESIKNL